MSIFALQQLSMIEKENKENESLQQDNRKTYLNYTREMRIELIKLVDQEKLSTAEAGRKVGIKQTSACRIMKSYHKHNRIFERKEEKLAREAQLKLEGLKGLTLQNIRQNKEKSCDKKQKKNQQADEKKKEIPIIPSIRSETKNQNIKMIQDGMLPNMSSPSTPVYCLDNNYFHLYFSGSWSVPFFYL